MSLSNKTHSLNLVSSKNGFALYEITADEADIQRAKRFYVVRLNPARNQVYDAIPDDAPKNGGKWFAGLSAAGVSYVANGRTRATARRWFNALTMDSCEEAS